MSKLKTILCALLCLCLLAFPTVSMITASGAESLETMQEKLKALEDKSQEYQEILDKNEADIKEKKEYSDALVGKIEVLDDKIALNRKAIEKLNTKIDGKQKEIDKANAEIDVQVDALCGRLKAIYMAGSASDLEIILGAKNFSDMIDKVTLVKRLSKYDKDMIDEINVKLEKIGKQKADLETDKANLEEKETSLKADQEELNNLLADNEEILKDLYTKNKDAKKALEEAEKEAEFIEKEVQNRIEQMRIDALRTQQEQQIAEEKRKQAEEEARRRAEEAASQPTEGDSGSGDSEGEDGSGDDGEDDPYFDTGGYTWPVPGFYYLSSQWNEDRGSYNHGAIDIAGAGIMGASVVAADTGIVFSVNNGCPHNWGKSGSCGCGGGYGNYVMIDHLNGKITIYAHLTNAIVENGQTVSKGQLIGYVGSTGYSTGPHLHFECRYNGVKYDPMTEFY